METALARERAAEQRVRTLLKDTSLPIADLIPALNEYRAAWSASLSTDHAIGAEKKEAKLWQVHTESKRYFHKALSDARRNTAQPVALRQVTKLYLNFIKDSERFYREHIYTVKSAYCGIPELEAIAHKVKSDGEGESSRSTASPEQRKHALDSCHRTLIYIGDLLRYRGSERLDKTPDFRPAIGFYDLACSLRPSSGLGHHQRAVIALEQKHHLRAIYHLYRAIVLDDPHPNAANNLKLEFEKTNAAWDQGALIQKGPPGDPDASKNMLIGWFVRLHSMCFKGQTFRGYDELEKEVLAQLVSVLKQRDLDGTLLRMVLVNMSAQHYATERFKESPHDDNQNALLQFMRINVKTFTALSRTFHEDLKSVRASSEDDDEDIDLTKRLTPLSRRLLPTLRLYGIWLMPATVILAGVASYDLLKDAVDKFWHIYAQTIDLMAAVFPVWDLDDLGELGYLLEEDVDTLGFKALEDDKTHKVWHDKHTGKAKPRWSDAGVVRGTEAIEMLARIKDLLADGVSLATYEEQAPLKMQGMRILHRDAEDVSMLAIEAPPESTQIQAKIAQPVQVPKPVSYATAARGPSKQQAPANKLSKMPTATSRDAQLSRMVDNLVDDSESNNPVTPPQQHRSNPMVITNGDVPNSVLNGSTPDFVPTPNAFKLEQKPIGSGRGMASPPAVRTPTNPARNISAERLQAVSSIWDNTPQSSMSPHFPAGLPTGTLGSPAQMNMRGHSRVNSASSIRSRTSQGYNGMGVGDSWSSLEFAQRGQVASPPMLFGLGGGPWSNGASFTGYRNTSPSNGQAG